jgi:hypothetical protein
MFRKIWSALKSVVNLVVDLFSSDASAPREVESVEPNGQHVDRANRRTFMRFVVEAIAKVAPKIADRLEGWSTSIANRYARTAIQWAARGVRRWAATQDELGAHQDVEDGHQPSPSLVFPAAA